MSSFEIRGDGLHQTIELVWRLPGDGAPMAQAVMVLLDYPDEDGALLELGERVQISDRVVWQLVGGYPVNQNEILAWAYPPMLPPLQMIQECLG